MRNIYYVDPKMSDINDFGKIFLEKFKALVEVLGKFKALVEGN